MTLEEAHKLDAADPLGFALDRFRLPDGIIYLDGNSLGALPAATPEHLRHVAEGQWGDDLIASWNKHDWIDWPTRIAAKLAPIIGAKHNELLIAESLMGLSTLVCDLGATRLGVCDASGCDHVFVDTSPNQSRRYCSDRCSSRANVAAYRARQRAAASA